ncbi:hypothetical protein NS330_13300 [Curtobacterium citreum]|nr:hypothetical protein NS330_13300 [Curtobacterium citreum]
MSPPEPRSSPLRPTGRSRSSGPSRPRARCPTSGPIRGSCSPTRCRPPRATPSTGRSWRGCCRRA